MYLYSSIIGSFVFNEHFKLKEKIFFSKKEILQNYPLLEQEKEIEVLISDLKQNLKEDIRLKLLIWSIRNLKKF